MDKIAAIRSKFLDKVDNIPSVQQPEIRSKMNSFERATEDEIKNRDRHLIEYLFAYLTAGQEKVGDGM